MARRVMLGAACLCAAAVLAALLGGCIAVPLGPPLTGGNGQASTSSAKKSSASGDTRASGPAMPGAALSAGSLTATVQRADASAKSPTGAKAPSGKTFLLVQIAFRNQSSEAVIIRPQDFTLKSSSGAVVKPFGPSVAYNAGGMRPLNPFLGAWTEFIYQVPAGSVGYVFSYTPEVSGKKPTLSWSVP